MVRVVETALPSGVTLEGTKLQLVRFGNPEQANVTVPLNPDCGATLTLKLTDWPGLMAVAPVELELMVKSGGPEVTLRVMFCFRDPAGLSAVATRTTA
jgi:hypothetical protein